MFSPRRGFTTTKAQTLIYDAWEAEGVQASFAFVKKLAKRFLFRRRLLAIADLYQRFWKGSRQGAGNLRACAHMCTFAGQEFWKEEIRWGGWIIALSYVAIMD
jgi:hypothetical protein